MPSQTGQARALQKRGNELFAKGEFQKALAEYAAALAAAEGPPCDSELAATLRSNRSLCCLKLDRAELGLSEAERCKELRPDWPKAHFRVAAALRALGRLGDARLAACEARRLAPGDKEVGALVASLRREIFPEEGGAVAVGEALDTLEDFGQPTNAALAAAQLLHDALMGGGEEDGGLDRQACIKAFLAAGGAATVFRRQNAMGDNWREECKNGTMSLLSKVAAAAPQLEEDLVRLSKEAEVREHGCSVGERVCKPQWAGKAGDSAMAAPVQQPPPVATETRQRRKPGKKARPLTTAYNLAGTNAEVGADMKPTPEGVDDGPGPISSGTHDESGPVTAEESILTSQAELAKKHAAMDGQTSPTAAAPDTDAPPGEPVVWPNFLECLDVVLPGDGRRLAVAGAVAFLAETAKEGGPPSGVEEHLARVTAIHAASGRPAALPAALLAGSRRAARDAAPAAGDAKVALRAVVGLSARNALPGPRVPHPAGSLEVRTGLAFVGPGGGWLQGGAGVLVALLEAHLACGPRGGGA